MTEAAFEGAKTAKVNGATLAYREQGEGEPVVFVHGGISDLRVWDAQIPEIGRSHRAIAYSRRYARPNEPVDPDASDPILAHVEDLVALVRELGAEPAHLVGNSWGALICLHTGLRHPEVVRSLVLEEPPAITLFAPTVPPRMTDLLRLIVTRPRTAIALFQFMLGTMIPAQKALERGDEEKGLWTFAQGVMGKKPLDEIPKALRDQMYENRSELHSLFVNPEPEPPPLEADAIRDLRRPVLLVTGALSPPFALRITDYLEELLPIVERTEIRGASHVMHVEEPAATNAAILEFLERHSAKAA
jgi:pimeloyl-ACP methyl ester carboxylesterase